jgi:hypothetical protein
MARKKKTVSKVLDKAKTRLASLRSIDPNLDLGNGNTAAAFETAIETAEDDLEGYNTYLSLTDDKMDVFKKQEKLVANFSQTMLSAVGSKYGFDSKEYEKAGGVPKSKRKKPTPKNGNGAA